MDKLWLYLAMGAGTAALAAAIVISARKPKQEPCAFKLEETKTSFGLVVLALALGYGVMVYKLVDPAVGGEEPASYGMIAVLGLAAVLMAVYVILLTLNQKIYVREDGLTVTDAFGRAKKVEWADILSVDAQTMQKGARFTCAGDYAFKVSGANKDYRRFMEYVEPRLKEAKEKDLLSQVERNLR